MIERTIAIQQKDVKRYLNLLIEETEFCTFCQSVKENCSDLGLEHCARHKVRIDVANDLMLRMKLYEIQK